MKHTPEMIQKIKDYKRQLKKDNVYNENPEICAILLSFNHVYNVDMLHKGLEKSKFDEVIICEDGSIDGSFEKWNDLLEKRNHYMLRSRDIHELRAYDKAIKMSESKIFCLLQDDDIIPESRDWVDEALTLFKKYPKLGILGGARGRNITFKEEHCYGLNRKTIPYKDSDTDRDFMFIENINIGPYFMRKDVYNELGGWDKRCSNAGEPGILFESEMCYRAWMAGYQVGLCSMNVKADDDDRGTMVFNEGADSRGKDGIRQKNCWRNQDLMKKLYTKNSLEISKKILDLNKALQRK